MVGSIYGFSEAVVQDVSLFCVPFDSPSSRSQNRKIDSTINHSNNGSCFLHVQVFGWMVSLLAVLVIATGAWRLFTGTLNPNPACVAQLSTLSQKPSVHVRSVGVCNSLCFLSYSHPPPPPPRLPEVLGCIKYEEM